MDCKIIQLVLIILIFYNKYFVVSFDKWEEVDMICPQQCVCQFAHRMDLSISRWVHAVEMRQKRGHEFMDSNESGINSNEVTMGDEISPQDNELLKFTMCLLPSNVEPRDLILSLPHDVEALVILSTESRKNSSVLVSDFNQLFDLKTLEIRGSKDGHFVLKFDEPISWIQHFNIENVHLEAAETLKFRPNLDEIDPSENFNYVPSSERVEYNISFAAHEDEVEIVPYEVYKLEKLTEEIRLERISFYGWDNLKVLKIKDCWVDDLYWEMFDGLSNLQHLSLEGNGIREISPFAFYGTPNIQSLSLAHNDILDLSYRSLAGLLKLQLLDMSDNNIVKLSEQTFPPFPNLEIFDLRDNPIQSIFPQTFGVLNRTEVLYLGSEKIPMEFSTEMPFEHLNKLKYLEIGNLNVRKLDESTFKSLENLEILKIKSGKIPFIEFDSFSKMMNLRELHLTKCEIEEISMDTFFGAKKLEIVDLSHNKIRAIPPGIFYDQHEINEIYLNDNQLTSLPTDIFKLNSLKMIHLTENPWECSCAMKNWRQSVINKVKNGKIDNSKCSMKNSKCERNFITNYAFDHRMSPKCATPLSSKGKSVFYALRRVLQCSSLQNNKIKSMKNVRKLSNEQKYEKYLMEQKRKGILKSYQYRFQQHGKVQEIKIKSNHHSIIQDHDDISNDF